MAKTSIRKEQGGVPKGGSTGEALIKLSGADFDTVWGPGGGGGGGSSIYKNGNTTKNAADASVVQLIPHGCAAVPSKVRVKGVILYSTGSNSQTNTAQTVYDGTTQSSISTYGNGTNAGGNNVEATTFTISSASAAAGDQTGVITFDATNIIITWTKTGSPTGTYQLLWEAVATGTGVAFSGTQVTEIYQTPSGDFSVNNFLYDSLNDQFFYAPPSSGGLQKAFVKSVEGFYQPVVLPMSGITTSANALNFIYNGNIYIGKIVTGNVVFDVYNLTSLALLGTTNTVGAYAVGSSTLLSCHATNDGRWVGSWCFNGVNQVTEADISSTLVFAITHTYNPSPGFSQQFSGAPLSWGTYKASKNSTNYVFQGQVYDYSTSGAPSRIAQCFVISARVLAWGTTLQGKTIIMYVPGSYPQGNPSGSVSFQVYIRYLDTTQLVNYNGNAIVSVIL